MPGKVNPSVPEMVNQVCSRSSATTHVSARPPSTGQLELNVMMPVIAYNCCSR